MGDYNIDYLIEKERQNLDTILTPYLTWPRGNK